MEDLVEAGRGTLRDRLLRWTAIGGVVVGGVNALQLVVAAIVLDVHAWFPQFSWPTGAALRFCTFWLNIATIALLLVGSVRLWRGLRGARPLLLAYAIVSACAYVCYVVMVLATVPQGQITWLIMSAAHDLVQTLLFPAVVLVVLFRLAPSTQTDGDNQGFEVIGTPNA